MKIRRRWFWFRVFAVVFSLASIGAFTYLMVQTTKVKPEPKAKEPRKLSPIVTNPDDGSGAIIK